MPKQKITKQMIVDAAFELARNYGMECVTVKAIAAQLGCSGQPIYSYCENMKELRRDVAQRAKQFIWEYIAARQCNDDIFASTGRAYVHLAKEEPHIFKIFILHERENICSMEQLFQEETEQGMNAKISTELGFTEQQAKELYLNMIIYTIGIGTIFAVTSIPPEEIFDRQKDAYNAFVNFLTEKGNE